MSDFFDRLRKAAQAAASEWQPSRYEAAGKQIVCPHCGNAEFAEGKALLNAAGMSFIELDWANSEATTLSCTRCSRVEWFHERPNKIEP